MRLIVGVLLILGLLPPAAAVEFEVESFDRIVELHGVWRFRVGDDLRWASPEYDHREWDNILVPRDWLRQGHHDLTGMAWYRAVVQLDLDNPDIASNLHRLGVSLGKIHSAYEFYAGGQLLGGAGQLPPDPRVVSDKIRIFPIPPDAVADDGTLVLAVRVWREDTLGWSSTAGMHQGNFIIGAIFDLTRSVYIGEGLILMLAIIYLVFGLYHLYLYAGNRRLREFLWFGITTIMVGLYSIELSQWKHVLGFMTQVPYIVHRKLEYALIYLVPATGAELVMAMLNFRPPRWVRLYQAGFVLLALAALLVPGTGILVHTLFPWQILTLPLMFCGLVLVIWYAVQGNTEARTIFVGWAIFLYASINDILLAQGVLQTPRLLPVGFAAVLISMAISLANRFTRVHNHLEGLVRERTAALESSNEKLIEAARKDTLTGLLNRRGFIEVAEVEVPRTQRTGRSFTVMLADVDRFKSVNDRYGHGCGDFALRRIAELLGDQLRDVDTLARWGGEEFIFLLPETDPEGGRVLAEKLRQALERTLLTHEDHLLQLTITIGVAAYTADMESIDDCIALADDALYEGKQGGRNQVVVGRQAGAESGDA